MLDETEELLVALGDARDRPSREVPIPKVADIRSTRPFWLGFLGTQTRGST